MWMATTDDRGTVKYWQSNMNNVHSFQAHNETIRGCRWDARPKTTGSGTLSSSGSGCLHVTVSPVCLVLCCDPLLGTHTYSILYIIRIKGEKCMRRPIIKCSPLGESQHDFYREYILVESESDKGSLYCIDLCHE